MMRKNVVVFLTYSLLLFSFAVCSFADDLKWEDIGGGNLDFRSVLVSDDNSRIIYAGTKDAAIKTLDGGKSWRSILSIKGANKSVNFLVTDHENNCGIYAATGNGLYYSADQGKHWVGSFKGNSYLESQCTAVAVLPYATYLGTKAGFFTKPSTAHKWYRVDGALGYSYIYSIAYSAKDLYSIFVASARGLFKTVDGGKSWERIFAAFSTEDENETDEDNAEDGEIIKKSHLRYIAIDDNSPSRIYLATSRGVYRSFDKGSAWELMATYGLLNQEVEFLIISKASKLYAITSPGVFVYGDDRWEEVSLRLDAKIITQLALDSQNNLYAATNKGLFKAIISNFSINESDISSHQYYKDEPSIKEIQRVAMRYAEVEPDKILRWRKLAAKKAWLPHLSVGMNRDVTDLWHWESGSTVKSEDDVLMRGRDALEWDVSLSWDLGELVWSNDQTSIDVRSRLLVQLRGEILDEVTKIYFERLRLKLELNTLPIEDRKKRIDKELRLQELTASLDALTGGYFSECLRSIPAF